MFASIEEEMKRHEVKEPLRNRIFEYAIVGAATVVILGLAYLAITYLA